MAEHLAAVTAVPASGLVQAQPMDAFLCVHARDIEGLLDVALASYRLHFPAKGRLTIVTNDPPALRRFLDTRDLGVAAEVTADSDWLSAAEMELPGWFRQQIIKLRSYRFCDTAHFCNLGADTLLARPIAIEDILDRELPVMYYSRHRLPDRHWRFERRRLRAVAGILGVAPEMASRYCDFINDFFCFRREWLMQLDAHITAVHGPNAYVALLKGLDAAQDQTRFGEWTLYSVFVLDHLAERPSIRNAGDGFLDQVHGRLDFLTSSFDSKVIHIVNKSFDREKLGRKLLKAASPIHALL